MKKINITTIVLLIYLLIMSIIGWPGKQVNPNYIQYFAVIGATLLIIFLLRFLQIKRFKNRDKNR
jgi:putative Mn2+ efflux pump MntP